MLVLSAASNPRVDVGFLFRRADDACDPGLLFENEFFPVTVLFAAVA